MTKNREDLDMATIIDGAIEAYLTDHELTGAPAYDTLAQAEKDLMRQAFLPVIWSALPSILVQLNTKAGAVTETEEAILASFQVPDSLEGLVVNMPSP